MHNPDIGKLILRLSLGLMLLLHGVHKLQNGVGGIGGMLAEYNLPSFLAYGVFLGEVIGPLMIIIGYYTRVGAVLVVGNMLVALMLVHVNQIFTLNEQGGWTLELQGFYLLTAVALFFLGAGRYAVKS